ncbi:MAG: orange carotenoid protein N-terminal domain-containing protein [Synechococcus sp.]
MTFTTDRIANSSISLEPVPVALAAFNRLTTDEKLGLLWVIYVNMGGSITPAATGVARLQFTQGLLEQVKALNPEQQFQFMRDLVNCSNTAMTRAYGLLTNNTKLAFWYQLAELMRTGDVIEVPANYALSSAANLVYSSIEALEFNQQITLLRQAVINMGVDPLA